MTQKSTSFVRTGWNLSPGNQQTQKGDVNRWTMSKHQYTYSTRHFTCKPHKYNTCKIEHFCNYATLYT